jgi:maleate cis-trans isomerase
MAVPDRAARHPIVHADPLTDEVGRRRDRSVIAHVKVTAGEVAQREHRQSDEAAVAIVDAAQMAGHRGLAALYFRIGSCPAQHLGARRPVAAGAVDQAERHALGLDVADHQRRQPGVIGAGQADREVSHCMISFGTGAGRLSEYGPRALSKRPTLGKEWAMTHHFGALIPSTNTTVEIEYSHLIPAGVAQAHYGRMMSSNYGASPFASPLDADVDYQARLLGTARVEMIALIQTSACLFQDNYDEVTCARITRESGAPAITSAMAIGEALRALGARNVALVSPYSEEVNARARRYFEGRHGLKIVALEGFAAKDSYMIGKLGPENARGAFRRIDRPEIEAFVVPGGNFPTMASIAAWEAEFKKPVVTTN